MKQQPLNVTTPNREVGFFISETAQVTAIPVSRSVNTKMRPFAWIEAYFDATTNPAPLLLTWDGFSYASDNSTPIVNPVRFAYSGQLKPVRGAYLVSAGEDYLGNAYTSDLISVFTYIYVGGGVGGVSP